MNMLNTLDMNKSLSKKIIRDLDVDVSGCASIWRNVILGSTRPYRIERIGRWSYPSHLVVSCLDSATVRFCTCSTIRIYVEM